MTTWCSQSDVESILSDHGVLSYSDDDEDGAADAGIVSAAIERAAAIDISPLIEERYTPLSATSSNSYLKWANALFAAKHLTIRRNLPMATSLEVECGAVLQLLNQVFNGQRSIPEQHENADHGPFVTNYNVQRIRTQMPARVAQQESTGKVPHKSITRRASFTPYSWR